MTKLALLKLQVTEKLSTIEKIAVNSEFSASDIARNKNFYLRNVEKCVIPFALCYAVSSKF